MVRKTHLIIFFGFGISFKSSKTESKFFLALRVSYLKRGETRLSVDRLEKIANILGVDVTELMTSDESNTIMVCNSTSTSNLNIFSNTSESKLEAEIARLQLIISHKDEVIKMLTIENETLKHLINSLKIN